MDQRRRVWGVAAAFLAATVGMVSLLILLADSPAVRAGPAAPTRYVRNSSCEDYFGPNAPNPCTTMPCCTVQHAVDQADDGDEILVATGVYTGVQSRQSLTQTVYISKSVTIRGGYTGDYTAWDPDVYPTTLDARGRGRVIYITGDITPTLEGLIITGGDATFQTAGCPISQPDGCGGGIFVLYAHPIIVSDVITDNVATIATAGYPTGTRGYGGGICLREADRAVISGSVIISNAGSLADGGQGGGIHLHDCEDVLVVSNQVLSNAGTTRPAAYAWGGGLSVSGGSGRVEGNWIQGNRTNGDGTTYGAGIHQWYGTTAFSHNRVVGNHGDHAVYLGHSGARFDSNQVIGNETIVGIQLIYGGPGDLLVSNNVVAGSTDPLRAYGNVGNVLTATLVHNTLVGTGAGKGIYVQNQYVRLAVTNTLVASNAFGIYDAAPGGSVVSVTHTLFWGNGADGERGTRPVDGDPAFVAPGSGDFHVGIRSAAIDAGVWTGIATDLDGQPRLVGDRPDIGADEAGARVWLPLALRDD